MTETKTKTPGPEALVACDYCRKRWLRVGAMYHVPGLDGTRYWCGNCDRAACPSFDGLPFPSPREETDQNLDIEPIGETVESVGLILVEPPVPVRLARSTDGLLGVIANGQPYVPGCYRVMAPLHVSAVTGEARVLVVAGWDDHRAALLDPGNLPPRAGLFLGDSVDGVRVSRQYVALVGRAWGSDVLWGVVERGGRKYVAAWKLRQGMRAIPVAALAPLGEKHGTVDPTKVEA